MIYQKQFIKETTITAMAIFVVVLAILVFTQGINLLGRAADGRVAIEAVGALIGFWTLSMTPLLLVLTAYISILTVLTRYWRDSEMSIWLASGLGLRRWITPVLTFALPLAILVAVMQLAVLPWAELRSREYAELLKQKQNLSLVEQGQFAALGKKNQRVYFVEQFDAQQGSLQRLFIREVDNDGRDGVIFAQTGHFELTDDDNHRVLVLKNGYHYRGNAGSGDFEQVSFEELRLMTNVAPKLTSPIDHRRAIPTRDLLNTTNTEHQAELLWRISLPLTVVLLSLLAIPISYFNPRSGNSYHVLIAVGFFLFYQNSLTLLRDAVEDGKIHFWVGLLPSHLVMAACIFLLLRWRSQPAQGFWVGMKNALLGMKKV